MRFGFDDEQEALRTELRKFAAAELAPHYAADDKLARFRREVLGQLAAFGVLGLRIPAKIFIINENGDYFWLDRLHLSSLRQFVLFRSGLAGSGAVRTLVRLAAFPFTLLYLLLYAAVAHAGRALRRGI